MTAKLEVNQSTLLEVNGKNNAIQEGPEAIASGLQFFLQVSLQWPFGSE
jgi:hypothetical protein